MAERVLRTPADLASWTRFLGTQAFPMTVSKVKGAGRSAQQNRTIHLWYAEVAKQRGDVGVDEVRAELKLTLGVPILRRQNPVWREEYDELLKPMPYAMKLRFFTLFDPPVTRRMTTRQTAEYQDAIQRYAAELGFILTDPDAQGRRPDERSAA